MIGCRDIDDPDTATVGTFRASAGHVHQDVPHQPRRHGQEVRTVLPTDVLPVHQADERFVHQGSRLKHMAGTLAPEVPASKLAKLRVDERYELVEGGLFPSRQATRSWVTSEGRGTRGCG